MKWDRDSQSLKLLKDEKENFLAEYIPKKQTSFSIEFSLSAYPDFNVFFVLHQSETKTDQTDFSNILLDFCLAVCEIKEVNSSVQL